MKKDHEIRSYEMTKKYLAEKNIVLKHEKEVLESIKNHRNGFETNNLMELALTLSDKIDIRKNRLPQEGVNIAGLNQYRYVDDVTISIDNKEMVVKFIIDKECNKEKFKEWYFTAKVIDAINKFAMHLSLNLEIYWNDELWQ